MAQRAATATNDVRARLAADTREAHESLHVHPLSLALQARPNQQVVTANLLAARCFGVGLEHRRAALGVWTELTLAPALTLLEEDLGATPPDPGCSSLRLAPVEMLGALYVAHGAQFGRRQLAQCLTRAAFGPVPAYYRCPPDLATWRALADLLEMAGAAAGGYPALRAGALTAFNRYREALDHAIPCTHPNAGTPTQTGARDARTPRIRTA